jgi:ATP-binding cassette subfamily B protein
MRPWRLHLVGGLFCSVAASALLSPAPFFLGKAIDDIKLMVPLQPSSHLRHTYLMAACLFAAALASAPFRYGMRELLNGVSRYVEYDLRNALFVHLEELDAAYFGRTRTGDIMARLTNDLNAVRMAAGPAIMYLVTTVAGGICALAFMMHYSLRLTALALLPLIMLPPLMVRLGRAIHDRFEAVQAHFSTITTHAQENLSGTRIVRAYRQEEAEVARFGVLNEEYLVKNMRLARLYGVMNPTFGVLAGLGAVIVLGIGGTLTLNGRITVGDFTAFGIYLTMLTWPLIALGWVINLFERGAASMGRLNEIFAEQSTILDPPHPRALPALVAGVRGRSLEFRNVSFHYPVRPGDPLRWVLRDVSFAVPPGATLGVVGATGSGKSALIDLIPRLYDPQEGEILIDGIPLRELRVAALRSDIGIVPQESLLFSDTIGSNLAYGLPDTGDDASADGNGSGPHAADRLAVDADAQWAAQVAQLDTTVMQFPGGYGTMLGERGINLSGGQKQRAALARALARRPALVLLDDALSAVDTHTEAEILHALRDAVTGRTAVIASHRVSAIREATWIVVLEQGRIVEQGRHEELLALGGRYWSLLRRQQLVDAVERDVA